MTPEDYEKAELYWAKVKMTDPNACPDEREEASLRVYEYYATFSEEQLTEWAQAEIKSQLRDIARNLLGWAD